MKSALLAIALTGVFALAQTPNSDLDTSNRQFHDTVLRENRIPVEMIRAALTNQKLSADYSSTWKFYGTAPQ